VGWQSGCGTKRLGRALPPQPMTVTLRNSGIPLMDDVPWGSHLCVFYQTRDDLFDAGACYFEAGLQENELCVWLIPDSLDAEQARAKLAAAVEDAPRHIAEGRMQLLPAAALGPFDLREREKLWAAKLDQALASGYEGLRAAGDASVVGDRELLQEYERDLHDLLGDKPVLGLCTYALDTALAEDVFDVVRAHNLTVARRRGQWQFMETPELERANAQIRNLDDALAILSHPFPGHELLTERERMVLAFLVKGASSKEAARDLGISPRTIDFHRANIIEKLGARNTADAIRRVLSRA
jgi:DNA-binding CsgD family transcriptional regulator